MKKKESKTKERIIYISLAIILITFLVLLSNIFISKYPLAKLSYETACLNATIPEGYSIAGATTVENDTANIQVFVSDCYPEIQKTVIKHENCHKVQYEEHRVFSCELSILRIANELECYVAEDMSDKMYNVFY